MNQMAESSQARLLRPLAAVSLLVLAFTIREYAPHLIWLYLAGERCCVCGRGADRHWLGEVIRPVPLRVKIHQESFGLWWLLI